MLNMNQQGKTIDKVTRRGEQIVELLLLVGGWWGIDAPDTRRRSNTMTGTTIGVEQLCIARYGPYLVI